MVGEFLNAISQTVTREYWNFRVWGPPSPRSAAEWEDSLTDAERQVLEERRKVIATRQKQAEVRREELEKVISKLYSLPHGTDEYWALNDRAKELRRSL